MYKKKHRDTSRRVFPHAKVANSNGTEHMENGKNFGGLKHNYKKEDGIKEKED